MRKFLHARKLVEFIRSVSASRDAPEPRGEPGVAARGVAARREPLRGAPEVRQVLRPALADGRAGTRTTHYTTVIVGCCDTVGEWQKFHNKQFVTISEHFTVVLD